MNNNIVKIIGYIRPTYSKVKVNNKEALKIIIKSDTNNIPVYFIEYDYKMLCMYKNKKIVIYGHIDTKWGIRIIVDVFDLFKRCDKIK